MNELPIDPQPMPPPLPPPRYSGFGHSAGSLFAWILAAVGGIWLFTPVIGIPAFLLLVACVSLITRTVRRRRALAILSYIEQAVRLNLPLPAMLRAARDSETGITARRLDALGNALDAGEPLELALSTHAPEISPRMVRLAGAGGRLGSLPQTMRILLKQERADRPRRDSAMHYNLVYALSLTLATAAVLSVYIIFVLPKFQQIFKDFRLQPPAIMRWMLDVGRYAGIGVLVAAAAIIPAYVGMKFWEMFHPSNYPHEPWTWAGWLMWRMPLAHRVVRDRGLGDVCRVSGEALRAGFSLDRALAEATHLSINPGLRVQLRMWLYGVQEGLGAAEAARNAALPSLLSGMLHAAEVSGGTADALEFLGRYYESRFSRAALLLQGAVAPAMSLIFGAIVCAVALSAFMPMIRLIEKVGLPWHRI